MCVDVCNAADVEKGGARVSVAAAPWGGEVDQGVRGGQHHVPGASPCAADVTQ